MVQIPILRPRPAKNTKVFGASLSELQDRGLVEDGVPVVLRRLVEHLRRHGEKRLWRFVSCSKLPCFLFIICHSRRRAPLIIFLPQPEGRVLRVHPLSLTWSCSCQMSLMDSQSHMIPNNSQAPKFQAFGLVFIADTLLINMINKLDSVIMITTTLSKLVQENLKFKITRLI